MTSLISLVEVAEKFIGVNEGGGKTNPQIEDFQKTITGRAVGQSWCMDFVQYCVKQVCQQQGITSRLPNSQGCLDVWNSASQGIRCASPMVGAIVIWNHLPGWQGHCGIVTSNGLINGFFDTIEGNTTPGPAFQHDGIGVYRKQHRLTPYPGWRLMGFLLPFDPQAS